MKYIAHGMSMLAWMIEFDSDLDHAKDAVGVWNEAASASQEQTDSRVMEQSNRITTVHPEGVRCQLCPAKPPIQPEPKPEATGVLDAEPHP